MRSLGKLNVELLADFPRVEIDAGFAGRFIGRSSQKGRIVIIFVVFRGGVVVMVESSAVVFFVHALGPNFRQRWLWPVQ